MWALCHSIVNFEIAMKMLARVFHVAPSWCGLISMQKTEGATMSKKLSHCIGHVIQYGLNHIFVLFLN